jgi:M6 family metalloprotease-like protein
MVASAVLTVPAFGWDPPGPTDAERELAEFDFGQFRTPETAIAAAGKVVGAPAAIATGYLGIYLEQGEGGKLVVAETALDSPAAVTGVLAGDILLKVEGQEFASPSQFRDWIKSQPVGKPVKLSLLRSGQPLELSAQLAATSRPLSAGNTTRPRAIMGVQIEDAKEAAGALVREIITGSPAEKIGLKAGDIIARVDGNETKDSSGFRERMSGKAPGEMVKVLVKREAEEKEYEVQLASSDPPRTFDPTRGSAAWRRDLYNLAVVLVEFPDQKHNDKIPRDAWEQALFSDGRYIDKSVTGQTVYGSVKDYYREQSYGKFRVEGKVFDWIEVSKPKTEYATGTNANNKGIFLGEALDKLLEREGKNALADFDGVFYLYAGERIRTNRGGLYWPHRANFSHANRRVQYFICPEGGNNISDISVICHEFGHMLGLPDLYARPENPGSEGMSIWCAMSNQAPNGRPQHFSAWCKEQLGWITPTVIDPTVKQKLLLDPSETGSKQCYKILLRSDGSEYLLLENRRKLGFDASLPSEGLLIWRVVGNRPMLEESHGIEGPAGPGSFRDAVPYPSKANNSFTPFTTPSSRSQLGGGLPVHITNIKEHADGRVTFYVGYEFE